MTVQANIAEAKAKPSSLLDRALAGEEIVIARAGKPMARLVPMEQRTPRKSGAWQGWKISNEALFAPMDPEDLDAAGGKHTDEFGVTLPRAPRIVRLLVDTHAPLRWLTDDPRLSYAAEAAISNPENDVFVSASIGYEIAYERRLGRLSALPKSFRRRLGRDGIGLLPTSLEHALAAASLPRAAPRPLGPDHGRSGAG